MNEQLIWSGNNEEVRAQGKMLKKIKRHQTFKIMEMEL